MKKSSPYLRFLTPDPLSVALSWLGWCLALRIQLPRPPLHPMSIPSPEEQLAAREVTRLFRVLSDETRFRLLRLLSREELTVNELARITQLAQPRISNHLKILREEELLIERRDGSWRHYRVDMDQITPTAQSLWPMLESAWDDESQFAGDDKRLSEVMADRSNEPRRSFFDELAGQWDEIRDSLFGDALGREILRIFLPRDLVVADIGTGTGYVLQVFANRVQKLIAIDKSAAMLEVAQAKAEASGLSNVEFRLVDIEKTSLKPNEADLITMIQVLQHLENPAAALRSIAAGLRPDGSLIVSDFLQHDESWLREQLQHRWSGFSRVKLEEWLAAANLELTSFEVLPGRVYVSPEGHRLRVPDGFTAVAVSGH